MGDLPAPPWWRTLKWTTATLGAASHTVLFASHLLATAQVQSDTGPRAIRAFVQFYKDHTRRCVLRRMPSTLVLDDWRVPLANVAHPCAGSGGPEVARSETCMEVPRRQTEAWPPSDQAGWTHHRLSTI